MNKKQPAQSTSEKVTSEKPVSLSPLDLKDALSASLKIKPKLKEEKKQEKPND